MNGNKARSLVLFLAALVSACGLTFFFTKWTYEPLHQEQSEIRGRLGSPELYPAALLTKVADGECVIKNGWERPRAAITGIVSLVRKEDDGDWHIRLEDPEATGTKGMKFIVCEIIPELLMAPPKVGQKIRVKGIVRYDAYHPQGKWWELHPVTHWEVVK